MAGIVDRWIARLPSEGLQDIAGTWRNVLHKLSLDDADDDLRRLLSEIHAEWERRRTAPRIGDLASQWKPDHGRELPRSPLSAHGYNVQFKQSLWNGERQDILKRCFEEPLMPAFAEAEMREWGEPNSAARLRRILGFFSYQIRSNATQKKMQNAVDLWWTDIAFLRALYERRFQVEWPERAAGKVQFVGD